MTPNLIKTSPPEMPNVFEIISVTSNQVACDGGHGGLGHPRVWLHLGIEGRITCAYCSRHYILDWKMGTHNANG